VICPSHCHFHGRRVPAKREFGILGFMLCLPMMFVPTEAVCPYAL
jgi:hypothetical protein